MKIPSKVKPNPKLYQVWFETNHNAIFGGNFRSSTTAERSVSFRTIAQYKRDGYTFSIYCPPEGGVTDA